VSLSIEKAISDFGRAAKSKLANPAVSGQPEDQLRGPFERLIEDVAMICNFRSGAVVAVGEATQRDLKTRPDYSITVNKALVGFVELKAPGKGATMGAVALTSELTLHRRKLFRPMAGWPGSRLHSHTPRQCRNIRSEARAAIRPAASLRELFALETGTAAQCPRVGAHDGSTLPVAAR
jgi:hypothetical protein